MLSALGVLLKNHLRGEDIACRYGGEEFLLILPGASLEVALERGEILRQSVKEMHLHYQSLKPTTLSLGVALYPDHGNTGLDIIKASDAALYRAKKAGRDRVTIAEYSEETIMAELQTSPIACRRLIVPDFDSPHQAIPSQLIKRSETGFMANYPRE